MTERRTNVPYDPIVYTYNCTIHRNKYYFTIGIFCRRVQEGTDPHYYIHHTPHANSHSLSTHNTTSNIQLIHRITSLPNSVFQPTHTVDLVQQQHSILVNMVFGGWFGLFPSEPVLEGEAKVPPYFPVQPRGCEKVSDDLFQCITNQATAKARDMEKVGLHKSYFDDVMVRPQDEAAAQLAAASPEDPAMPKAGDNPLDECRTQIAYYMRCCDRELKKKKNWILTEPFRVQEEYRYSKHANATETIGK